MYGSVVSCKDVRAGIGETVRAWEGPRPRGDSYRRQASTRLWGQLPSRCPLFPGEGPLGLHPDSAWLPGAGSAPFRREMVQFLRTAAGAKGSSKT